MNESEVHTKLIPLGDNHIVPITCSPFFAGRTKDSHLVIEDLTISRPHCRFTLTENKTWILEDVSSSGTFVNDVLVGKGSSVTLKNYDIIRLGPLGRRFYWQFETNVISCPCTGNGCYNSGDVDSLDVIRKQITALQNIRFFNYQCHSQFVSCEWLVEKEYAEKMKEMKLLLSDKCKAFNRPVDIQQTFLRMAEREKVHIDLNRLEKLLTIKMDKERFDHINKNIICIITKMCSREMDMKIVNFKEQNKGKSEANSDVELSQLEQYIQKMKEEDQDLQELKRRLQILHTKKQMGKEKVLNNDMESVKSDPFMENTNCLELNLKTEIEMRETLYLEKLESVQKNGNRSTNTRTGENTDNAVLPSEVVEGENALNKTEKVSEMREQVQSDSMTNGTENKSKLVENIEELMETELQCSICSELFVTAISLNCSHTFCKHCIDLWKKKKKQCPICRQRITSQNRSIAMDNYINKMVDNLSEDFKKRRLAVIADRNSGQPGKRKFSPTPSTSGIGVEAHGSIRNGSTNERLPVRNARRYGRP